MASKLLKMIILTSYKLWNGSIGKNKYIGGQKLDSNSCQFKKNHNDKMISLGSYLSQFSVHFYWWPIFDGQVVNLDLKSFRQVEDLNLT